MTKMTENLNSKVIAGIAAVFVFAAIATPASAETSLSDVDQALNIIFCSDTNASGECQVALLIDEMPSFEEPARKAPTPPEMPVVEEDPEGETGSFGEPGGC